MIADPSPDGVAVSDDDFVSIMTIHAAKGLEFETVFLPAWEEGIFPNDLSVSEDGLEEERRLAYVAMTRAKKHCFILHSAARMQYGSFQHNPPSRFIAEIDGRFLNSPNAADNPPLQSHAYAGRREYRSGSQRIIGRMVDYPGFGSGVIIEMGFGYYIVAFKSGIKKISSDEMKPFFAD